MNFHEMTIELFCLELSARIELYAFACEMLIPGLTSIHAKCSSCNFIQNAVKMYDFYHSTYCFFKVKPGLLCFRKTHMNKAKFEISVMEKRLSINFHV